MPWTDAHTLAAGLRVPSAFADRLILRALRESGGTAVAVPDAEIVAHQRQLAALEGLFVCPEGAATLAWGLSRWSLPAIASRGEEFVEVLDLTGCAHRGFHLRE